MSEATNKATGHRMKMVQKTLGLSAREMASAMGYTSKSNYYRVCRGETRITEERLYCLRDTYGVNLDYLLYGDDSKGVILKRNWTELEGKEYSDESLRQYLAFLRNWFNDISFKLCMKRLSKVLHFVAEMIGDMGK